MKRHDNNDEMIHINRQTGTTFFTRRFRKTMRRSLLHEPLKIDAERVSSIVHINDADEVIYEYLFVVYVVCVGV